MAERLKQIPRQLLDLWNKYSTKQKTIIISVLSVIILAFALLIFLIQKVDYKALPPMETAKESSQVVELLKGENIAYKLSTDQLTVSVDAKYYSDAVLLLASNDMPSAGISVDELLNNSLSTTNSDRTLKLNLYLQNQLRNYLKKMEGIDDASVYYIPSESNDTILSEPEETSASVLLTVNEDFQPETAQTIAEMVASVIGNKSSDQIKVVDQEGNLLFGGEQDLYSGSAISNEDFREKLRNNFVNSIYMGLMKSGNYSDVEIMPNLVLNMDRVTELYTEYSAPEGQDQGLYQHSYTYKAENADSSGGTPGTDSNDETTYLGQTQASNNSTVETEEYDYLPNKRETNTQYEIGAINKEESSVGIVLRKIKTIKEEELKTQGLLDGITFEQYIQQYEQQNGTSPKIEVDPSIFPLVSMSTGISENRISISAYEVPVFVPKAVTTRSWTDYLMIVLAVLIVGLLIFVVFKGIGPVEVTELEPELSVEQLLATTKENQSIEDIEFNEVSEVRRMIEKFVDEKPEAVAQLLRNWLNEDWS